MLLLSAKDNANWSLENGRVFVVQIPEASPAFAVTEAARRRQERLGSTFGFVGYGENSIAYVEAIAQVASSLVGASVRTRLRPMTEAEVQAKP